MAHGDTLSKPSNAAARPIGVDRIVTQSADLQLLCGFADVSQGLQSRHLREMLDHYACLVAAAGGLPGISKYDPVVLPCHMANILIVQLEGELGGQPLYRYTMFGAGLRVLFGTNMTGRLVADHHDDHHVGRAQRILPHVVAHQAPVRSCGHLITRNGVPVMGETILLPFGADGAVTHILADVDYDNQP